MSKNPKTDEPTEPTPEEIITEELEAARARIDERNSSAGRWTAPIIAQLESAARIAVADGLRPPPLKLPPRPPLVNEPLETTPPARTRAQVDGRR